MSVASNSQAVAFAFGAIGSLITLRYCTLPVYVAKAVLGGEPFFASIRASVAAACVEESLITRVALLPLGRISLSLGAMVAIYIGLIYLTYKTGQAFVGYLKNKILEGDVETVSRLKYCLPLVGVFQNGSLYRLALASENNEMVKLVLSQGEAFRCFDKFYAHHFSVPQSHLAAVFVEDTIDVGMAQAMWPHVRFNRDSDWMARLSVKLGEDMGPFKALFTAKLKELDYAIDAPIFQSPYLWLKPKLFIEAGYGKAVFKAALDQEEWEATSSYLFDELGIEPSLDILQIALKHQRGEALARDLMHNRGIDPKELALPYHGIASSSIAASFMQEKIPFMQSDGAGNTAFHLAAQEGNLGVFSLFSSQGHNPFLMNLDNKTVFHLALESKSWELIEHILYHHELPKSVLRDCERALLFEAVRKGRVGVVRRLAQLGTPLDMTDRLGQLPLHIAAKNGHLELVDFLAEHVGYAVDLPDRWEATPAQLALDAGQMDVYHRLIQRGAQPSPGPRVWDEPVPVPVIAPSPIDQGIDEGFEEGPFD